MKRNATILLALLALAACGPARPAARAAPRPANPLPASVSAIALGQPAPCTGNFVAHDLDHITTTPHTPAQMFEANGSGAAIGDLDGDGRLDVVLANSYGPNTILWNQGDLRFRAERMPQGDSRAVNLVDVDGDGRLDMVFTRRQAGPSFWRNLGANPRAQPDATFASVSGVTFANQLLPNVALPAYAMAWGDLNGDGALDMVAGSYDAELLNREGNSFLMGPSAGVYVYQRDGDTYRSTQLAHKAQALAIALFDANLDGRTDVVVGNDFAVQDGAWVQRNGGWAPAQPFRQTSHSTMGFDSADVDNHGQMALFSTDMKPYDTSIATLAEWQPMMVEMFSPTPLGDPQIVENVLQVRDGTGFRNQAYARGISATGWSWSGVFGDLDDDGMQDLYVVNGMIEARLFRYLPHGELVERNQALRNDGGGSFAPAPEWGLGSERSGRGMAMADLNGDGKLDIVVNNLAAPSQLFENRLCGGDALEVDLRWPGSKNTRALGAIVTLHTSTGDYTRDARATAGYLSGPPSILHFGFPANATLDWLEVRWPDGKVSAIDSPHAHTLVTVER